MADAFDRDVLAGLVLGVVRTLLLGGGEVADDGVQQGRQADPLRGRGDEDRRQHGLADALVEACVELGVRDVLLPQVLLEDRVVRLGRSLEQLVPAQGHLGGHLGRHGDLDLAAALEPPGLAVDEVHVAGEGVRGPDGEMQRGDLVAEHAAQLVEGAHGIRVLAVALVEHETGGRVGGAPDLDRRLQAGVDAAGGVHHVQRRVGRVEPLDHLGDEVRVARRVDDGDLVLAVLERPDREAQRAVLLLLLGLVVEVRRPVVDLPHPRDRAGAEQHLLGQRRLPAPGMAGEHDAADVGEVVALQRHRARFLSVCGRPAGSPAASGKVAQGGRLAMRATHPTMGARAPNDGTRRPDDSRYTRARCQDIPSGPRSSARRASTTRSAAPCSPRSRARSRSPRARAAVTPTPTTGSAWRWTRRARSTCPRTTSSARSRRPRAAGTASSTRRSSTRATGPAASRSSSRRPPTIGTAPRPRSGPSSPRPAASSPAAVPLRGSSSRAA